MRVETCRDLKENSVVSPVRKAFVACGNVTFAHRIAMLFHFLAAPTPRFRLIALIDIAIAWLLDHAGLVVINAS